MKSNFKFLTALASIILFAFALQTQAQTLEWVKQMGGTDNEEGLAITTDVNGNVYSIGNFKGTVDFDPGPGTFNLTSAGDDDMYIQKLDALGALIWVRQMGGSGLDKITSITLDVFGNIYTTGGFTGTVDFDPGAGTTNLTPVGNVDIFIQKLDANGSFIWAKSMGGTWYDYGTAITTDAIGNVYTTGDFQETVDFDPGSGVFNLTALGGYNDIFIQKLDASGNFLWAKQIDGLDHAAAFAIATDASGNIYTTGYFYGTADFDPGPATLNLTSAGEYDMYIQKLDSNGHLLWVKQMGGTETEYSESISIDLFGNVYTTGSFKNTVDFDPGAGVMNLTSVGEEDAFIQKLDSSGNFIWAKQMGGTSSTYGKSITTDVNGNVYTTGYFYGTTDFDPGSGNTNTVSKGISDIFVQKLDSSGNLIWVIQMGGSSADNSNAITIDADGNMYITGAFSGTSDFDPGTGVENLTALGSKDIFVQKLKPTPVGIMENEFGNKLLLYPNPTSGKFSIDLGDTYQTTVITITDLSGRIIQSNKYYKSRFLNLNLEKAMGIYLISINSDNKKAIIRLVKD